MHLRRNPRREPAIKKWWTCSNRSRRPTSSFNQYFFIETASASQLRQALATLPTSGWRYNPSTVGEMKRCQLLFNLAEAESKLGNELEAIEHMESVYKMLPKIRSQLTQQQVEEIIYRLGLLYLRYGETQNCCLRNTPDSCIIPFQTAALHTQGGRIPRGDPLLHRIAPEDLR